MRFPSNLWVWLLIYAACISLSACHVQGAMVVADTAWAVHERTAEGCVLKQRYMPPAFRSGLCISTVTIISECADGQAVGEEREQHVAFPARPGTCDSLRVSRDFFPESIFGSDEAFLATLRHVSEVLREERFAGLRKDLVHELSEGQMSLLVAFGLDPNSDGELERFRLTFHLPKNQRDVVLMINEDGSEPEWAILME